METPVRINAQPCPGSIGFIDGPIDPATLETWVRAHSTQLHVGAFDLFIGQVRADPKEGQRVTAIEYTSYPEMAGRLLEEMRQATAESHSLVCLHILHSLGVVPAGGISLLVMAAAAHRREARAGCVAIVERIKKELPVWGKEWLDGDGQAWKENH